eukprot:14243.XXX_706042_705729_1 [CDS] Oithona nana genome sequencing.
MAAKMGAWMDTIVFILLNPSFRGAILPNWLRRLAKRFPIDFSSQESKKISKLRMKKMEKRSDTIFDARNQHARIAGNQGSPILL